MHSSLRLALIGAVYFLEGCRHLASPKEQHTAQIHYDLGIQAQQVGDVQSAYREFEEALKLDPVMPEAHNAAGVLLHLAFKRPEEAIAHYKKALAIRPDFSEVKTNLANVYLDQNRLDESVELYQQVLNDMLYPTPYIAQGNLGWALFKKGQTEQAIDRIKSAVTTNPQFCLGYRNLGLIYDSRKDSTSACRYYGKYREHCPEIADAYYREGLCLSALGQADVAKERFVTCEAKAGEGQLKDDCHRMGEH